jgi:hypothetical protein
MDITSTKSSKQAGLRDRSGFRERKGHGPIATVPKYHIVTEQGMAECRPDRVRGIKINPASILDAREIGLNMRCTRGGCALIWNSM